jgi:hypothetical protein
MPRRRPALDAQSDRFIGPQPALRVPATIENENIAQIRADASKR